MDQKTDNEPDLKDVHHYIDAQKLDHQHHSSQNRVQQLLWLRSKLLQLPQEQFDLMFKAISKMIDQDKSGSSQVDEPAQKKKEKETLMLYDEVKASTGEAAVRGVPSV